MRSAARQRLATGHALATRVLLVMGLLAPRSIAAQRTMADARTTHHVPPKALILAHALAMLASLAMASLAKELRAALSTVGDAIQTPHAMARAQTLTSAIATLASRVMARPAQQLMCAPSLSKETAIPTVAAMIIPNAKAPALVFVAASATPTLLEMVKRVAQSTTALKRAQCATRSLLALPVSLSKVKNSRLNRPVLATMATLVPEKLARQSIHATTLHYTAVTRMRCASTLALESTSACANKVTLETAS